MFDGTKTIISEIFEENNIAIHESIEEAITIPQNVALVLHSFEPEFPYSNKESLTKQELYSHIKTTFGYSISEESYEEEEEDDDDEEYISYLQIIEHLRYRKKAKVTLQSIIKSSNDIFHNALRMQTPPSPPPTPPPTPPPSPPPEPTRTKTKKRCYLY